MLISENKGAAVLETHLEWRLCSQRQALNLLGRLAQTSLEPLLIHRGSARGKAPGSLYSLLSVKDKSKRHEGESLPYMFSELMNRKSRENKTLSRHTRS